MLVFKLFAVMEDGGSVKQPTGASNLGLLCDTGPSFFPKHSPQLPGPSLAVSYILYCQVKKYILGFLQQDTFYTAMTPRSKLDPSGITSFSYNIINLKNIFIVQHRVY